MKNRIIELDALRGLAAQPVVLSHTAVLLLPPSTAMFVLGWAAHLSVIFFFMLSGYAIIGGLRDELAQNGAIDLTDYAIRRSARIYPPYLLTVALVLAYFALPDKAIDVSTYNTGLLATARSLVFAFTSSDAITLTPVWSLRIEVVLYVIAGLLFYSIGLRGLRRIAPVLIAALLTAALCWMLSFGFRGLLAFAFGGLISISLRNAEFPEPWRVWHFFAPLGDWSYTLYLIHMPLVLLTIECLRGLIANPVVMLAACVLVANIASALFATMVERPRDFARPIRRILAIGQKRASGQPV